MVGQELHGDHGEDALKYVNSGWDLQDLVREGHGLLVPLLTDDKGLTSTSNDLKMNMDILHTFQSFEIINSKLNRSFLVESFKKQTNISYLLQGIHALFVDTITHYDHANWHICVNHGQRSVLKLTSLNAFTVHVCQFFDL